MCSSHSPGQTSSTDHSAPVSDQPASEGQERGHCPYHQGQPWCQVSALHFVVLLWKLAEEGLCSVGSWEAIKQEAGIGLQSVDRSISCKKLSGYGVCNEIVNFSHLF